VLCIARLPFGPKWHDEPGFADLLSSKLRLHRLASKLLHTVSGHPILNLSALEAAKHWVFRPMESNGQNVGFLALLVFYYSTDYTDLSSKPDCTKARWK